MRPIVCVAGTRPEVIKLAPVVAALRHRGRRVLLCSTGQQRELLDRALLDAGLAPDVELDLMRPDQTPAELVAAALPAIGGFIAPLKPEWLIVQGDTASAFAGALAGVYAQVPVAHVEAGLRSGDPRAPYPEEHHRRAIAQLAAIHFAPTRRARDALLDEGVAADSVHFTGNSVIDALHAITGRLAAEAVAEPPRGWDELPLLVVTAHRRESHGARLAAVVEAVARLAATGRCEIVIPVHPHPAVRGVFEAGLRDLANVRLVAPLPHQAFLALLMRARAVLTDSGGVQEEAPALGCPVLVLRDVSERPEGIEAGVATLVGTDADTIVAAALALLTDDLLHARMSRVVSPYGDGHAAARIAAVLDGATAVGAVARSG